MKIKFKMKRKCKIKNIKNFSLPKNHFIKQQKPILIMEENHAHILKLKDEGGIDIKDFNLKEGVYLLEFFNSIDNVIIND